MEDSRPLRSRIYAILRDCDYEETRQVLEFIKELKPQSAPGSSSSSSTTKKVQPAAPTKPAINVEIDYLCGKWMHCVGLVAQWTYDMYFKGKRPESYEKVLASTKICYAAMLPIRLVAVDGPECVGSVSIVKNEQGDRSLTPFITFLCVPSKYKGMDIEQKLIRQSVRVLKGLGYKEAFIKADKKSFSPDDILWEPVQGLTGVLRHQIN